MTQPCPHCETGLLVPMHGEGRAICNDCKEWTVTERPETDNCRAKRRSMKLGDKRRETDNS